MHQIGSFVSPNILRRSRLENRGLEQHGRRKGPNLEFFMLGTAILEINGEVIDLGSRRAVYLLSLLCTREEPISMDKILEEMWPDWDYHTARNNFYFTLHRLRKFLNNKDLIPFKNGQCWIESELFWTDIKQFDLLVEESRRLLNSNQKNRALAMLTHASALYRGELLEGMELGPILALEKETMAKILCIPGCNRTDSVRNRRLPPGGRGFDPGVTERLCR